MNKLTLSIVIPVYNEESYLKTCLQAISKQTEMPEEVIVVDNNSSDNSVQIAKLFPFVKLYKEARQGLYFSRQTGMDSATGDILARIDADTVIDDHWVEVVKKAFMNPKIQGLTGPVGYYDMPLPKFVRKSEDVMLRLARAGKYDFMMGANMAIRKSAWELVREELCNENFVFEDIDIVVHLSDHNIRPDYLPVMSAFVSARRFADNPKNFLKYIGGHTRTLEHHFKVTPAGAHFAEGAFVLAYLGVKPFHMVYDPELRRPSLAYLLKKTKARPDPMNGK